MHAETLRRRLHLKPHPEGGWYREFYRAEQVFGGEADAYPRGRAAATAIYFLLERGDFSAFHRVAGDELWVHLGGGPLELTILDPEPRTIYLGQIDEGYTPIFLVPGGTYQAAAPLGDYALVTCTVAPGFSFEDFELAGRAELVAAHPGLSGLIERFTR